MRWLALVIALIACDGDAWSPRAEHDRAAARRAVELAAHLEAIPGIRHASVVLNLPFTDPLAPPEISHPPVASVVIDLEPGADSATTQAAARAAVEAAIPGASATVLTAGPVREAAPATTAPYRALLAIALAVIAGLALWIVAIYRRAARAQ